MKKDKVYIAILAVITICLVGWIIFRETDPTTNPAQNGDSSRSLIEESDGKKGGPGKSGTDEYTPEQQRNLDKKLDRPPAAD